METETMAELFRHRRTKGAANRYAEPNVHRATLLLYRKTIAWGMPDVSGASAVNTGVLTYYHYAHTRLL